MKNRKPFPSYPNNEKAETNGEMALVMLSELFNHSNIAITKRYLGLRKEEILHCYDLLDF